MNLRKRISKLQNQNREVIVKEYSLVTFEGYRADDAARNFWIGALVFAIVAFFIFWISSGIMTSNSIRKDPKLAEIAAQNQKQKDEQHRQAKQQYVDSCKAAGRAPSDMGDQPHLWECK